MARVLKKAMDGFPCHTEKLIRADGFNEQRNAYCKFYDPDARTCDRPSPYGGFHLCYGADHCRYYVAAEEPQKKPEPQPAPHPAVSGPDPAQAAEMYRRKVKRGTCVVHKVPEIGFGTVTKLDGQFVTVRFLDGEKTFPFPDAFVTGFLKVFR